MQKRKKSVETWAGRLLVADSNYLKHKVKNEGQTDSRFRDKSSALSHYVHVGIAAEKQVATGNSLGERIIRETQREVIIDSLDPLKEVLDKLTTAVTCFGELQAASLEETKNSTHDLQTHLSLLQESGRRELENIFIIRSVLFVFLLGIQTNRIQPDEKTPWDKLIAFAHDRARELARKETALNATTDSELVRKLANELFAAIREYQPAK